MEATCIFKRIEKKYLLSEAQQEALFQRIGAQLRPDEYGRSTVLSLYLDTPDRRIIRNSVEAVDYKEKLRLRSYGTAKPDSAVFLELKKKYGGVVYKRRAAMTLKDAERYLRTGIKPFESQIMSELDWAMRLYGRPKAAMLIACEREAWFDEAHPDLRRGGDPAGQLLQIRRGLSADAGRKEPPDSHHRRRRTTCRQSLVRS